MSWVGPTTLLSVLHMVMVKVTILEPDPRKIGRRVWEIGWGGSMEFVIISSYPLNF